MNRTIVKTEIQESKKGFELEDIPTCSYFLASREGWERCVCSKDYRGEIHLIKGGPDHWELPFNIEGYKYSLTNIQPITSITMQIEA